MNSVVFVFLYPVVVLVAAFAALYLQLVAAGADCDYGGNCPVHIFHPGTSPKPHIGKGESLGECHLAQCLFPRDALRCADADFMGTELDMSDLYFLGGYAFLLQ